MEVMTQYKEQGNGFMFDFLDKYKDMIKSDEEVDAFEGKDAESLHQKKIEEERQRLIDGGVNAKFYDKSFDDFNAETESQHKALSIALDFVKHPSNKMLLFYGTYGTGKTMLASSIIREIGGQYITAYRLCLEFNSGSDYKSERSRIQVLDYYSTVPFLVVDEVGTGEKVEGQLLSNILNERYENNLPSCLISNLEKKEIVELLGKRSFDRMVETCISVEFTGKSYRTKRLN